MFLLPFLVLLMLALDTEYRGCIRGRFKGLRILTGLHLPALPLRCFSEALLIQVVIRVETACIVQMLSHHKQLCRGRQARTQRFTKCLPWTEKKIGDTDMPSRGAYCVRVIALLLHPAAVDDTNYIIYSHRRLRDVGSQDNLQANAVSQSHLVCLSKHHAHGLLDSRAKADICQVAQLLDELAFDTTVSVVQANIQAYYLADSFWRSGEDFPLVCRGNHRMQGKYKEIAPSESPVRFQLVFQPGYLIPAYTEKNALTTQPKLLELTLTSSKLYVTFQDGGCLAKNAVNT